MKNITLIFALIIATTWTISAQYHGCNSNNYYNTHYYNNNNCNGNYSYSYNNSHRGNRWGCYAAHHHNWTAVCATDFNRGCNTISRCGYDSDRLRAARRFIRHNHVSAHQISHMMGMLRYESSRLSLAKYAFNRTCDRENYYEVFNQLSFNSSRRELDRYINYNCL